MPYNSYIPQLCTNTGSNVIWSIPDLDTILYEMSYVVDICDCDNLGTMETLASTSYSDSETLRADYPVLPSSLVVEVVDLTGFCGVPGVGLGERPRYN